MLRFNGSFWTEVLYKQASEIKLRKHVIDKTEGAHWTTEVPLEHVSQRFRKCSSDPMLHFQQMRGDLQ